MGKAIFAAALSLVLAGLGHVFLGLWRGLWFAMPSILLLYLYWTGQWEYADVVFLSLGIFAAFDAFSFAQRGYGVV
ncbi:MAG: hypothetical protein D4R81_07070 [Nitrospiraceae bacterium]|nr:MAG: hypothetical protein D4R81_07070 [Nitrospiraceae bacterium]